MKKYIAFFRMRFAMGLQYRAAALGGLVCQFFWGAMAILAFQAFYESDPGAFPMEFHALSSYIWLQQALLIMITFNGMDNEFLNVIQNGNVAYELCRPVSLYPMWYARTAASRVSAGGLRCGPTLLVALLIPAPLGLMPPPSLSTFLWFLLSLALAVGVVAAMTMIVLMITFHTISPRGVRLIAIGVTDFFAGAIIPLPFFPQGIRQVMELLPFSAIQNVPLRIYTGDICGPELGYHMLLQVFWLAALIALGKLLEWKELKNVVIQGG